mgnify:CR=1 FL=1|tara:strand:- start:54 stop:1238 length:1185 start_codon:yes stop_codon:yes gene_type:complete
MKVLLLTDNIFPTDRPIIHSFWKDSFVSLGNKLTLIMRTKKKQKQFYWSNSKLLLIGVNYTSRFSKFYSFMNAFYLNFWLSFKIIRKEGIDIVHSHDGPMESFIALFWSKFFGIKFTYAYTAPFIEFNALSNSGILRKVKNVFFKKIYELALLNCDLLFPISDNLAHQLSKNYGIEKGKIIPIPESSNSVFLNLKRTEKSCFSKQIVYIGAVNEERKLEFLLRSFKIVYSQIPESNLKIIGFKEKDLAYVSRLKKYVEEYNLGNSVEIIESLPVNKMAELVLRCQLGVSPIPPEEVYINSTPTKTIEYLSLGLPVVCNKEIIDQNTVISESGAGYSVNYDEESFAEAIMKIIGSNHKSDEMGKKGRIWVEKNRSFDRLASNINNRLNKMLQLEI